MVGRLVALGLRAAREWRLVLFDALLTLLAVTPLLSAVSGVLRGELAVLGPAFRTGDPRIVSLALAELLARMEPSGIVPSIAASALLLYLVRIFLSAALATSAGEQYSGVADAAANGIRFFRHNLVVAIIELLCSAVLVGLTVITVVIALSFLSGLVSSLVSGLVSGLVLGLLVTLFLAVRGIGDMARTMPRVEARTHPLRSIHRSVRWFFRIPFTAGGVAATWLLCVIVVELLSFVAERGTGLESVAGTLFLFLMFLVTLVARSAIAVARFASMGAITELVAQIEQDAQLEKWLSGVPDAMWVLPPMSDADDDDEWPVWSSLAEERDHDH